MQGVKDQAVHIAWTLIRLVRRVSRCMAGPITHAASDLEGRTATDRHFVPMWFLLLGLLLGVVASIVGYIGCFSVVQSTEKSTGPLSWLGLEAALSLLRMYIWSLNPQSDDAPPLKFVLALDDKPPLPTCSKYNEFIDDDKVLPLTRADQFLNSVTSFTGLINRFDHPDLTLYYALTRQQAPVSGWVLYIAVFDHKERTTRVYTRGRTIASSIPAIDLERGILETKLGETIDIEHDPIVGVDGIRTVLEEHYQSIIGPYSTMGEERIYHIENRWTMKRADTDRGAGASGGVAPTVKPSHEAISRDTWERDHQYLEQGRVERMLGELYTRRGKWVENYMALVMRETRERFEGQGTVRRVDGHTGGGKEKAMGGELFSGTPDAKVVNRDREEMEKLLIDEWRLMEILLVYEVERWEEKLWERTKSIVGGSPDKQRLTREWRGQCWRRLDANIRAMDTRMDAAKTTATSNEFNVSGKWQNTHEIVHRAWQAVMQRFMEGDTSSSMPLRRLDEDLREITEPGWWWPNDGVSRERFKRQREEMASRLRRELEDIEYRLNQGLDHCDQFWVDEWQLLKCRHSRSKTLILQKP